MTSPGSRPKKSGFLANLQASMAPAMPTDDDGPLVRPRSTTIASVLVLIAGVIFLLIGALSVSTTGSQVDAAKSNYASAIKQCNDYVGGIGSAVASTVATPTSASGPLSATALPSLCRQVTESTLSDSSVSSFKTQLTVFSVLLIIVGLGSAASGWFMREGKKWTRRALIAVVLVQLILAFLFQVSNPATLLATLLIVVGLSMTFLGKSSVFFMSVALRKKQH